MAGGTAGRCFLRGTSAFDRRLFTGAGRLPGDGHPHQLIPALYLKDFCAARSAGLQWRFIQTHRFWRQAAEMQDHLIGRFAETQPNGLLASRQIPGDHPLTVAPLAWELIAAHTLGAAQAADHEDLAGGAID